MTQIKMILPELAEENIHREHMMDLRTVNPKSLLDMAEAKSKFLKKANFGKNVELEKSNFFE